MKAGNCIYKLFSYPTLGHSIMCERGIRKKRGKQNILKTVLPIYYTKDYICIVYFNNLL
jgi:hypothetical protein